MVNAASQASVGHRSPAPYPQGSKTRPAWGMVMVCWALKSFVLQSPHQSRVLGGAVGPEAARLQDGVRPVNQAEVVAGPDFAAFAVGGGLHGDDAVVVSLHR